MNGGTQSTPPVTRKGSLMRVAGLIRKEFLQIVRDPSSIAIAFLMPFILLLLFGYGVSLDAEHVPVAFVVEQPDADTASLVGSFMGSPYFSPTVFWSMPEAIDAMSARRANAIVHLRPDFGRLIHTPAGAPIQVILEGTDANTSRLILGYIEGAVQTWLSQQSLLNAQPLPVSIDLRPRIWFNPDVRSRNFLVPGLVAVIMTLIGALLTSMVVAREWERGTLEGLAVTPVKVKEILLGKLIPYFILGMGGMTLAICMAYFLFQVPLRGSLWLLIVLSALFLLVALGMGLLISILARNQFVAGQIAIIVTFLPAFLLSGFIFDIASMPTAVQLITHIVAARYYVAILQTLFLAGNIWNVLLPNAAALFIMAVFFLGVSMRKFHKRLE
ncbi:MAG: ABC transporter permease [Desulfomonilaceae bacterium]